ncbi:peptide ABC transporter substrate-binding protein [Salinibacillus aidingensis]|uniref:Peptide ABC transporter substrate-binding protein n=1 Tax=Salinibacillus aidingensis TaxID=237684 RepID=A0ABN1B7F1_9BACI
MKKSKWSLLLVLGLVLSLFLAACSGGDDGGDTSDDAADDSQDSSEEGSSEEVEQTFNLLNGDTIPTMDSSMATDEFAFQFLGATMEGLYRVKDGEIVEGIAKDHTVSEDGLTWTFELREDAKWSNGDPVTAHDFVYAWRRAVNPDTGSEYGPYMMGGVIKNATEVNNGDVPVEELGVSADGDYKLVVDLANPTPYFESLATFGTFLPLNKDFVEEQGDAYATSTDTLLFNGPFTLDNWESTASSWELNKNPEYWDAETVKLEKQTYQVVKDPQTAVNLYEEGEADRAGLSSDLVDQYSTHDDYTVTPEMTVFYLKMNQTRNEALANVNVRRAISRAFDKQGIVDTILNNGSMVANGLVPEDFYQHPETGEDFRSINGDLVTYDPEQAKEYWEQGLEELGTDSVELEFLAGDSETAKSMNEFIVNELESNLPGLDLTLVQVPFEQRLDADTNMDYDIQFAGWGPDYMDPYTWLNLWLTDGGNNKMGYSNEEYDELVESTKNTTDMVARMEAFLEAEKILFEDAAIAPVYQSARAQLISPKVENVYSNSFGPTYEYKWAEAVAAE